MVQQLFARFLDDPLEYEEARNYWVNLWTQIDEWQRRQRGWRHPWLSSGVSAGVELRDGNPIFSAYSSERRCGIRIVQYPPTSNRLELDYWLDTFGGELGDPGTYRELVIACALSEESGRRALELMEAWSLHSEISERTIPYPSSTCEFTLFSPGFALVC